MTAALTLYDVLFFGAVGLACAAAVAVTAWCFVVLVRDDRAHSEWDPSYRQMADEFQDLAPLPGHRRAR